MQAQAGQQAFVVGSPGSSALAARSQRGQQAAQLSHGVPQALLEERIQRRRLLQPLAALLQDAPAQQAEVHCGSRGLGG